MMVQYGKIMIYRSYATICYLLLGLVFKCEGTEENIKSCNATVGVDNFMDRIFVGFCYGFWNFVYVQCFSYCFWKPVLILWWFAIASNLFQQTHGFMCSDDSLVKVTINGKDLSNAVYFEERKMLKLSCKLNENFVNVNQTLDQITLYIIAKDKIKATYFTRQQNDTTVTFTIESVPFDLTVNANNNSRSIPIGCCLEGYCARKDVNQCTQVKSVQVVRKLLPIIKLHCFIKHFEEIICEWSPSIGAQKNHTGVSARHKDLKVTQMFHWKLQGDFNWSKEVIDKGNRGNVTREYVTNFHYRKNQLHSLKATVQDLFEKSESAIFELNTTESIRINGVKKLGLLRLPSSRTMWLNWQLPDLPQNEIDLYPLEAMIVWKGWNVTKEKIIEADVMKNLISKVPATDNRNASFELTELIPNTEYDISVSVRIKYSKEWSLPESTRANTMHAVPDRNPNYSENSYNIDTAAKSCSSPCVSVPECETGLSSECRNVIIYWQLLQKKYEHGANFKYLLQYKNNDNQWIEIDRIRKDNHKPIQVPVSKTTQVKVLSTNEDGKGPNDGVVITIPKKGAELVLESLLVESENGSIITMSWFSKNELAHAKYTLFWCDTKVKFSLHDCSSDVSNLTIVPLKLENGHYNFSIDGQKLIEFKGGFNHRAKRSPEKHSELHSNFKNSLFGVAAESQGQTSGIVWSETMYFNDGTAVIEAPVNVDLTSAQHKTMSVKWLYKCLSVCARPDKFKILWCSKEKCGNTEWQSDEVSGSNMDFTIDDVNADVYTVKVQAFSALGVGSAFSVAEKVTVAGPVYTTNVIILITLAILVGIVFAVLGGCFLFRTGRKCREKMQTQNLIEMPGPYNRRQVDSTSSRYPIIGSQSSSAYGRQTSLEPLINHRLNSNCSNHMPPSPEEEDEVFNQQNPLDLSIMSHQDFFPLVPVSVAPSKHMDKIPPGAHFKPKDFITIRDEYMTTGTPPEEPKQVQKLTAPDSPESGSEDTSSYCVATMINEKKPVESDDRIPQSDVTELYFLKDDSNNKHFDSKSSHFSESPKTFPGYDQQSIDDLKQYGLMQPEDVSLFKPIANEDDNLPFDIPGTKSPTEDYWKSSTSGSDVSSPQKNLHTNDRGKGFSEPFLDKDKSERNMELGISENADPNHSVQDDLEKNPKDKCFPTSLSHGSLPKPMFSVLRKPNGYVDVSTSTVGSINTTDSPLCSDPDSIGSKSHVYSKTAGEKIMHSAKPHNRNPTTNNQPSTQAGYISMEELAASLPGSKEKHLNLSAPVPTSKSFPLSLSDAQKPYVSLEDVKKITGSSSLVGVSTTSLPITNSKRHKLAKKALFLDGDPSDCGPIGPKVTQVLTEIPTPRYDILGKNLLDSANQFSKALNGNMAEFEKSKINDVEKLNSHNKNSADKAKYLDDSDVTTFNKTKKIDVNEFTKRKKEMPNLQQVVSHTVPNHIDSLNLSSQMKDKDIDNIPPNLMPVFRNYSDDENSFDDENLFQKHHLFNNVNDNPVIRMDNKLKPVFKDYCEEDNSFLNLDGTYSPDDSAEFPSYSHTNGLIENETDEYCPTELKRDNHNEKPKDDTHDFFPSVLNEEHNINENKDHQLPHPECEEDPFGMDYCITKLKTEAPVIGQVSRTPSSAGDSGGANHEEIEAPTVFAPPPTDRMNSGVNEIDYVATHASFD